MIARHKAGKSPGPRRAPMRMPSKDYDMLKGILDLVLGALLYTMLSPVIVLALVVIRMTSPGPALYSQVRVGRHGRPFTMYKLRTMYHRCEEESGPRWSPPQGDDRVTPVGRFLRRTKIDELPQLWNVLLGEMSLIGPRPERPVFVSKLDSIIPHYRQRLEILPGLTGLAQIQLPPDTDMVSVRRKLACDLYYVQNLGLWLDVVIITCTFSYLLGIPFSIMKKWLRVPTGPMVEAAYRDLGESVMRHAQPV